MHLSALNFNNTAAELLVLRVNIYKNPSCKPFKKSLFFPEMTPENAFVTAFESSDVDSRHSLDRPTDPFCGWRSKSVAGAARLGFGTAPCAAGVFLYSVRGSGSARGGRGSKTAF